ncbi:MAG: fatty acid desaturase [Acidimicrobiia bacterium]
MSTATDTTETVGPSLADVVRIIPDDCYENPTAKGMWYFARDMVMWLALVAGLIFATAWWQVAILWVLSAYVVSGLFVLGHDAAHLALFKSRRLNEWVARVAMIPSAHVYEAWDLGHNRVHHGHTARQEMDFVWHPVTVEQYRAMNAFQRARHRLEWSAFGSGFYYAREVWWNKMITFRASDKWAARIASGRRFTYITYGLLSVAVGMIGYLVSGSMAEATWIWVRAVVVPTALFMGMIGFTVYVHHISEDIRWWPRREWTKFRGQMEGTTILHLRWPANLFFHNIFVHVPHHVDMRIPFYKLPDAADVIRESYPDTVRDRKFRMRDWVRTTRHCKLYDFEHGEWLPYSAARTAQPVDVTND